MKNETYAYVKTWHGVTSLAAILLASVFFVFLSFSEGLAQALSSQVQLQVTQTPAQQVQQPVQRLEISVRTDKGIYRVGEKPHISGRMLLGPGNPATGFARIRIWAYEKEGSDQPEKKKDMKYDNIVEVRGGEFTDDGFIVQIPRGNAAQFDTRQFRYPINVEGITGAVLQLDSQPVVATTEFMVEEVGIGRTLYILAFPGVGILYVLLMVYIAFMRRPTKLAATTMLLMTFIVALMFLVLPFLGPLTISISPDLEALLRTTPVGFLKAPLGRPEEMQWVINIGGVLTTGNTLKGGIAVPLLILVLSMVGASINMLRKLPDFLKQYDAIPDKGDDQQVGGEAAGEILRRDLFRYFVYILTAPVIAMIAYSLMFILDYTNPHALSIVAFSVGFISDTVVETLLERARKFLSGKNDAGQAPAK